MRGLMSLVLSSACALAAGAAWPQAYPNHPVRIVVAFPPGGGTDIVARIVGQKLSETWGQQVFVDNRAGASGVIGTEFVAHAAPDGYTLMLGTLGNLAVNQYLYRNMAVDPLAAFAPITQVVNVYFVLLAHPAVPARNVQELIALAKSRPGQLTYSSSGPGGAPHLAAELFKRMAHVDLVHVPYKGSAPSFQDLIGGQVSVTFDSQIQALPFIRDGRLRPLAVLGKSRSPQLPDVPTVAESGLPDYELTNWFGLVAPVATPKEVVAKIYADVSKVLENPELRGKIADMSAGVVGSSPEQFRATWQADSLKWGRVVRETNMHAD